MNMILSHVDTGRSQQKKIKVILVMSLECKTINPRTDSVRVAIDPIPCVGGSISQLRECLADCILCVQIVNTAILWEVVV